MKCKYKKPITQREMANPILIEKAMALLRVNLERRIKKFGMGKHVSPAESVGILAEEVDEVGDAQHANDLENFVDEMLDVAVTGVWATVSFVDEEDE